MAMIEVNNLTKKFGDVTAVDGLTFSVNKGEVFGLLGPNGAGKTTTIRMLCCLIASSSGEANVGGHTIGGEGEESLAIRKLIGLVPDNLGLYEELSAYENLDFFGKLYETPIDERRKNIERYLTMMELWDKRSRPMAEFSKGMKQKVGICRALVHNPELLIFDEPTANLDPESSRVVREIILQLKNEGKTIFLNTHNLDEASRICDRIGILRTRLLAINTPDELERRVWGVRTVIEVEKVTEPILAAVRRLNPKSLQVEGERIILTLGDARRENPDFVQAIVSAGGRVLYVSELNPGLEETYLKVVQETK